jgi:hypothetical protein
MNTKSNTPLRAAAAPLEPPDTRFEFHPEPPAPFTRTTESDLDRLKTRLLRQLVAETASPALLAPLRRAANEAAALAWLEAHPLLVFPELFQEKARTARLRLQRQERLTARTTPTETFMVAEAA